jgi:MraZ protein
MASGYYGRYHHTVDAKGRVFVPVKLRDKLGSGFMAAAVLDHCISLYSYEEWDKLMEGINTMPVSKARDLQRHLSSNAIDVELDAQGRILLPKHLVAYGFLEKDVTVIGAGNHAEIWNSDRLAERESTLTDEALEEMFIELGF